MLAEADVDPTMFTFFASLGKHGPDIWHDQKNRMWATFQLECYREHGLRELRFRKTGKQQIGVSSSLIIHLATWHATPGKGNDATRSIEPIAAHLVRQSASIPEAIVGLARPEDDQNPEKNSGSTAFATRSWSAVDFHRDL